MNLMQKVRVFTTYRDFGFALPTLLYSCSDKDVEPIKRLIAPRSMACPKVAR